MLRSLCMAGWYAPLAAAEEELLVNNVCLKAAARRIAGAASSAMIKGRGCPPANSRCMHQTKQVDGTEAEEAVERREDDRALDCRATLSMRFPQRLLTGPREPSAHSRPIELPAPNRESMMIERA